MYKINENQKVVVIEDEGPIKSATIKFRELDDLKTIHSELYSKIKPEVDAILSQSPEVLKKKRLIDYQEFVDRIRQQIREGKSKVVRAFDVVINCNDNKGHDRYCDWRLTGVYVVLPEKLYMTSWEDWSSGRRYDWQLISDPEEFLKPAKSAVADNNEVTIKDNEGNVIFYHRGPKYLLIMSKMYKEFAFVPDNDQYRLTHPGMIIVADDDLDSAKLVAEAHFGMNLTNVYYEGVCNQKGVISDTITEVPEPYIHNDYR